MMHGWRVQAAEALVQHPYRSQVDPAEEVAYHQLYWGAGAYHPLVQQGNRVLHSPGRVECLSMAWLRFLGDP